MKQIVEIAFDLLSKAFDNIPFLRKLKGYRTAFGLAVLALLYGLDSAHVGPGNLASDYSPYLLVFTGLALNAKGRD